MLADNGRTDVAYRLLLIETYPSLGPHDSQRRDHLVGAVEQRQGRPAMNSFNHYAFGSVMAWVYRYAAGIDTAPEAPGFKRIVIRPRVDARLRQAKARSR